MRWVRHWDLRRHHTGGKLKIGTRQSSSIGDEVAAQLRTDGFRSPRSTAKGDGEVILLFVQVRRRDAQKVLKLARTVDPNCYLVIEDIRWRENALT